MSEPLAYVSWVANEPEAEFYTVGSLLAALREIHDTALRSHPVAVCVRRRSGAKLVVVLGANRSMLNFFPENYDGLGSKHSADLYLAQDSQEILTYYYLTHHSEALLRDTVPRETALECVKEFVTTEGLPAVIHWEDD